MTALDKLREIDAQASPGPWRAERSDPAMSWHIEGVAQFPCCELWGEDAEQRRAAAEPNAQLAALAKHIRPMAEALDGVKDVGGDGFYAVRKALAKLEEALDGSD